MSGGAEQLDLFALLRETQVSELALSKVPVLLPDQTVAAAVEAMQQTSHGSAVIVDQGRLIGILTERDLLRIVARGEEGLDCSLFEAMTRKPQSVKPEDPLDVAVRCMDRGGYRRLPVVDQAGAPVGLLDVRTVVDFVVEQMPRTVFNQASRALLTVSRREGA